MEKNVIDQQGDSTGGYNGEIKPEETSGEIECLVRDEMAQTRDSDKICNGTVNLAFTKDDEQDEEEKLKVYNSPKESPTNSLKKSSIISNKEPSTNSPKDSSIISIKEPSTNSPKEFSTISPKEPTIISPTESLIISPKESSIISTKESSIISTKESSKYSPTTKSPKQSPVNLNYVSTRNGLSGITLNDAKTTRIVIPEDALLNNHSGRMRLKNKEKTAEKVPLSDLSNSLVIPLNGILENGHAKKKEAEMTTKIVTVGIPVSSPLTNDKNNAKKTLEEYFIPANTHKKFLRGEKLYLTKDKRGGGCSMKKLLISGCLCLVLVLAVLIGVLAATGVLPSTSSEMRQASSTSSARPNMEELPAQASVSQSRGKTSLSPPSTIKLTTSLPLRTNSILDTEFTDGNSIWKSITTTQTPEIVVPKVLKGQLSIVNRNFTDGLKDSQSSVYNSIAAELEDELRKAFNETDGFIKVDVTHFLSGSIVVNFVTSWKSNHDPKDIQKVIQNYLNRNNGYLNDFLIDPKSINFKEAKNECEKNNGACSHICTWDSINYIKTCSCTEDMVILKDGISCGYTTEFPAAVSSPTYTFDTTHHSEDTTQTITPLADKDGEVTTTSNYRTTLPVTDLIKTVDSTSTPWLDSTNSPTTMDQSDISSSASSLKTDISTTTETATVEMLTFETSTEEILSVEVQTTETPELSTHSSTITSESETSTTTRQTTTETSSTSTIGRTDYDSASTPTSMDVVFNETTREAKKSSLNYETTTDNIIPELIPSSIENLTTLPDNLDNIMTTEQITIKNSQTLETQTILSDQTTWRSSEGPTTLPSFDQTMTSVLHDVLSGLTTESSTENLTTISEHDILTTEIDIITNNYNIPSEASVPETSPTSEYLVPTTGESLTSFETSENQTLDFSMELATAPSTTSSISSLISETSPTTDNSFSSEKELTEDQTSKIMTSDSIMETTTTVSSTSSYYSIDYTASENTRAVRNSDATTVDYGTIYSEVVSPSHNGTPLSYVLENSTNLTEETKDDSNPFWEDESTDTTPDEIANVHTETAITETTTNAESFEYYNETSSTEKQSTTLTTDIISTTSIFEEDDQDIVSTENSSSTTDTSPENFQNQSSTLYSLNNSTESGTEVYSETGFNDTTENDTSDFEMITTMSSHNISDNETFENASQPSMSSFQDGETDNMTSSTETNFGQDYTNASSDLSSPSGRVLELDDNSTFPSDQNLQNYTAYVGLIYNGTDSWIMDDDANSTEANILTSTTSVENDTEIMYADEVHTGLPGGPNNESFTELGCQSEDFRCSNDSECIHIGKKCDGIQDCPDGNDENECSESCGVNYQCLNETKCIMAKLRCDGVNDCENGSDEEECGGRSYCDQIQQVSCSDDSYCIKPSQICDNVYNCLDKSDERDCVDRYTCASSGGYYCEDGLCLPPGLRCDSHADCKNGKDEENCTCAIDHFKCADGTCKANSLRCDGQRDCVDGSDEMECFRVDANGAVQVFHVDTNSWTLLCSDSTNAWNLEGGNRLCQELGFSSAQSVEEMRIISNNTVWSQWLNINSSYWISSTSYTNSCSSGVVANVKCTKYECGELKTMEGQRKFLEQWPFMATIKGTTKEHACRAEILTPLWLITSVGCLRHLPEDQSDWRANVDQVDLTASAISVNITQTREIETVILHPHSSIFRSRVLYDFDMALIRLQSPLQFDHLAAICLPDAEVKPGITCFTSTFGATQNEVIDHRTSKVSFLPLTVQEKEFCNNSEHYRGGVGERMLCTNSEKLCNKDEAASLACISIQEKWYLAGLLTYQRHCGVYKKHPAVYANIYPMREYIEKVVGMKMYNTSSDPSIYVSEYEIFKTGSAFQNDIQSLEPYSVSNNTNIDETNDTDIAIGQNDNATFYNLGEGGAVNESNFENETIPPGEIFENNTDSYLTETILYENTTALQNESYEFDFIADDLANNETRSNISEEIENRKESYISHSENSNMTIVDGIQFQNVSFDDDLLNATSIENKLDFLSTTDYPRIVETTSLKSDNESSSSSIEELTTFFDFIKENETATTIPNVVEEFEMSPTASALQNNESNNQTESSTINGHPKPITVYENSENSNNNQITNSTPEIKLVLTTTTDIPEQETESTTISSDRTFTESLSTEITNSNISSEFPTWPTIEVATSNNCETDDMFRCLNLGGCTSIANLCNGVYDCPDQSDEWSCVRLNETTSILEVNHYSNGWSRVCSDNWRSVLSHRLCNQLGYMSALATDYILNNETSKLLSVNYTEASLVQGTTQLISSDSCESNRIVTISCSEFQCGLWSLTNEEPSTVQQGRRASPGGSSEAQDGEWPSVALLRNSRTNRSCSASVITPQWLTASWSCLANRSIDSEDARNASVWTVLSGKSKAGSDDDRMRVDRIVPHESAKISDCQANNDIVLVRLSSPATFGRFTSAVCLPQAEFRPRELCVVAGWELHEGKETATSSRYYLPVSTRSMSYCNTTSLTSNDILCAGLTDSGNISQQDDHGAALMCINESHQWELRGLLTSPNDCTQISDSYVTYTNVYSHSKWIASKVNSR